MEKFIVNDSTREKRERVYKMLWKRTMNEGIVRECKSTCDKKKKGKKQKKNANEIIEETINIKI